MKRSFLFLQGVCSPFFGQLADRLRQEGHHVAKINFNAGDTAYWGLRAGHNYRGRAEDLGVYIDTIYRRHGVTDQILFGDCQPIHGPAVARACSANVRTHVFEEGYFRPHWVTLERGGVNAYSSLPRDPAWYRKVGSGVPAHHGAVPFKSPFWKRAGHDVAYHMAGIINPIFFPHYQTHAPVVAVIEYAAYLNRVQRMRRRAARDAALIGRLTQESVDYYVLPLQLDSDAQIRFHSPFHDMQELMDSVAASFVRFAPKESRLVIKNHPLDIGLVDYAKICAKIADHYGIRDRIDYLESGNLDLLVKHARGVITVNSTVGSVALGSGCATVCLSNPIYNLPGLTFQGGLDRFWKEALPPDVELFQCFRNTVVHVSQINGGFYCKSGIDLAVSNALAPLTAEQSPLEMLL